MKTKLLILFLAISAFCNAQFSVTNTSSSAVTTTTATVQGDVIINCSSGATYFLQYSTDYNFNSGVTNLQFSDYASTTRIVNLTGLTPNKTYYFRFRGSYNVGCSNLNVTNSLVGTFDTVFTPPSIYNITANPLIYSANINYTLYSLNYSATSVVKYGLSSGALTNSVPGFSASSNWVNASTVPITGLLANTTYYYQIEATNAAGTNSSTIGNFTTSAAGIAPTITGVSSSNISSYSANIGYGINPNNSATTSIINYGVSSSALTSQVTGFSASGSTSNYSAIMLPGLSASTTYYYQIVATNATGSSSSTIESFTTTAAPPTGQLITEYNFNNTYNNINGNTPFGSNTGTSFVTGRDGVTANGALNINNTGSIATITGLPYGSSARTVSLWVKTNYMNSGYNMIFSYGQSSNSNAFGASYKSNLCEMFGYANNLTVSSTNTNNTWYHFVYTYDGFNAKIYKNGVLLTTQTRYWDTINSSNAFKLGRGVGGEYEFNGAIDDLKIYNYALTDAEVSSLYNTNAVLATTENTVKTKDISIYPNPAKEVLFIQSEKRVSQVEIYNMAGQKVLETKETKINTSNLKPGVYLVKIKDVENQISSQKIIIK